MRPYQGLNRSFLGKYLFPGMQRGMSSTVASYAAENAKRIRANRLDAVLDRISCHLRTRVKPCRPCVLRLEWDYEAQIRTRMVERWSVSIQTTVERFEPDAPPMDPTVSHLGSSTLLMHRTAINDFNTLKTSQANDNAQEHC